VEDGRKIMFIQELELTSELKALGFTKIYTIGKLLVLRLGDVDATSTTTTMTPNEIRCKFESKDLIKTTEKYLKYSLVKETEFTGLQKEIICTEVCKMLLHSANQQDEQKQSEKRKEQENIRIVLDQIGRLRDQNPDLTFEQWQLTLQEKYQNLYNTVQRHLPEIWTGLEFSLSILRILNIHKCTLPFIGLLLGRPGSGKTIGLRLLRKWYCTFSSDNFTPRAFQSHSTAVSSKEELEEIDMLPKLKDKIFLTPELAPTFSGKEEDLAEKLGIITRIADGHGLASDSGAHGHREYGDTMFTWVGATVDVPNKVFRIMSTLGPKLYFFRLPFKDKTHAELLKEAMEDEDFDVKEQQIQEALIDYLKWFDIGPNLITSSDNPVPKVQWNRTRDNDDGSMSYIINLAELLSYLRRHVEISDYGASEDLAFSASAREDVSRTRFVLYNLARGHALLTGRNYTTLEDIPLVVKTILSTAQIDRVKVFDLLIASKGKLTSNRIVQSLNMSKPTALKTMIEFKAIGLVEISDSEEIGANNLPLRRISLRPEFDWFLTDEFERLREGFVPTDHRDYMKKSMMIGEETEEVEEETRKGNGTHTHDNLNFENGNGNGHGNGRHDRIKKEELSWPLYQELEKHELEDSANHMQADKNTVSRKKLHSALVASGHFSAGEATQTIEDLIKSGKLEEVMIDTLRRTKWLVK